MKFVALVSGGKDSVYNIAQCLDQGHELVALANLFPRAGLGEEIDSYMFQTVGYRAVEYLSECMGVPLYRREISDSENAVVDDLSHLLKDIRKDLDFEGVSVGAIASTYQQLRVDSACNSVGGLVPLCFLWQRDQCELLDELVESGLDARIVKVAGYGLDQKHLGLTLGDARQDLLRLHSLYGSHPCGEGGEYETMVFNAPFFLRKMVMDEPEVVKHSSDDVYYLSFKCHSEKNELASDRRLVRQPPLLEPFFEDLAAKLELKSVDTTSKIPDVKFDVAEASFEKGEYTAGGKWYQTIRGTCEEVFHHLQKNDSIYYVAVILHNMDSFVAFNQMYNLHLASLLNPPSRACIEAPLPWEVELTVCGEIEPDNEAKGLHVQGRSFWAPANIGPYSQIRMVQGISYVAGQIGLIPHTLELENNVVKQAVLALQNAQRLLNTMHGQNWVFRVAIAYTTSVEATYLAEEIWNCIEPSIPLIVAEVSRLPRNAAIEWSFEAADLKYFENHRPLEDDNLDEIYESHPAIDSNSFSGYNFNIGFQTLSVIAGPPVWTGDTHTIISNTKPTSCVHWIPAKRVRYSEKDVEGIVVTSSNKR